MPCVWQHALCLRVSVIVLAALLLICRLRGLACGESDSDVACGGPFSLLLVRFLCDGCNDVALCVRMHYIYAEPLSCRNVRRRTVAMEQLPCSCMSRREFISEDHLVPRQRS